MKSIIEEGSSIAHAVEKAWQRAGNPPEFTIKIFQIPQKNFFGFTKVVAKIAIFFSDVVPVEKSFKPKARDNKPEIRGEEKEASTEKQSEAKTLQSSEWTGE